jgi:hypothetical protein
LNDEAPSLDLRQFGGSPLADEVGPARESPPGATRNRRRLVLLVHGYNNSEAVARESFGRFVEHLRGLSSTGRALAADAVFVYWPGDTNLGLAISAASYPLQVERAIQSGRSLGAHLADLVGPAGTPTEVYLVGHSLGCRLILETLREMSGAPRPAVFVAGVSLMAAAVPEEVAAERWPELGGIGRPRRTDILHSADDRVLHWAFPLGETAAGGGVFPRAVGRFGEPHGLWTWRRDLAPNDHGDYWADGRATTEAARLVSGPVPAGPEDARRAGRALPEPVTPEARGLPARPLAARTPPGA